jgi:hypothetical protein
MCFATNPFGNVWHSRTTCAANPRYRIDMFSPFTQVTPRDAPEE